MVQSWINEKFIAHRGLHTDAVSENTLAAFNNAIKNGYNIELDVQPTRDNYAVVYHDTHMGRLTNCADYVENLTFDYLNRNVRYTKTGEKIPLFSDVLKLCEGKTGLMVEIKKSSYDTPDIRVEPLVYDLLKNYKGDFVVKSFNPFSVKWFIDNAPEFTIGFLCEYASMDEYDEKSRALAEEFLFTGKRKVDFFDYRYDLIGSPLWQRVYGTMPCYTWVVRDKETQRKVKPFTKNIIFENYLPVKE